MPSLNEKQQSCAESSSRSAIHHPEPVSLVSASVATQTSDLTRRAQTEKPKPEALQKLHRVELLSISGWYDDPAKNEVYKISEWEVQSHTGNVYTLHWDMRDEYPKCNCQEVKEHRNCAHSEAVRAAWQKWTAWNAQKNSYDLAWEEQRYRF
jgi:hypothetical protein